MYISSLVISGFRVYKELVKIQFSPNFNVIVGENGSGKSNIIKAIEFIFNYETENSKEARSMNMDRGQQAEAYIELVLDNSDGKIPFPNRELTLRREFGGNQDKFMVNGVPKKRKDFLEEINFPKRTLNIVRQGTGACVSLMSEREYFSLLLETCGAAKITNLLADIRRIRAIVDSKDEDRKGFLERFIRRVQCLKAEREKIAQFNSWKTKKRAIEYVLFTRSINVEEFKKNEMLSLQKPISETILGVVKSLDFFQNRRKELDESISSYKETISYVKDQLNSMKLAENSKQAVLNKLNLEEREYAEKMEVDVINQSEAFDTPVNIDEQKINLLEIVQKLEDVSKRENETCISLDVEEERKELYLHGMSCNFDEKKMNKWIDQQLQTLKTKVSKVNEEIIALTHDIENEESQLKAMNENLKEKKDGNRALKLNVEKFDALISTSKKLIEDYIAHIQSIREEISTSVHCIETAKNGIEKAKRTLIVKMGKSAVEGFKNFQIYLKRVEREADANTKEGLKLKKALSSLHGPVLDCIDWNERLDLPMEAVAGGELLHFIVADLESCKILLKGFNANEYTGNVCFLPQDKLKLWHIPEDKMRRLNMEKDIKLLSSQCRIKEGVDKDKVLHAVEFLLESTLLCRSLETCSEAMREYGLKTVSLEGDIVFRTGVMKGGYHKTGVSTKEAYRDYCTFGENFRENLEKKLKLETELNNLERKLTDERLKCAKFESEREGKIVKLLAYEAESILTLKTQELQMRKRGLENLEEKLNLAKLTQIGLKKRIEAIGKYNGANMLPRRVKELAKVPNEVSALRKNHKDILNEKKTLTKEKKAIDKIIADSSLSELEKEERREKEEYERRENKKKSIVRKERLANLDKEIKKLQMNIVNFEQKDKNLFIQITEANKEFEKLEDKELRTEEAYQKLRTEMEISRESLRLIEDMIQELTEKRKDLGIDPESIPPKYEKQSSRDLHKGLTSCIQQIENYFPFQFSVNELDSVCAKFDELEEFNENFLNNPHNENVLAELEKFIIDFSPILRISLYQKFKAINKTFSHITLKLLGERGELFLVIEGKREKILSIMDFTFEEFEEFWKSEEEKGLRVFLPQFGGKSRKQKFNILGLSGGQKSLISISLILSFVKMGSDSFFILDEIDAPLDPKYREELANILRTISRKSQIILTTFNKELLEASTKVFVVHKQNNSSRVQEMSVEEGRTLLETSMSASDSSISDIFNVSLICQNNGEKNGMDIEGQRRHDEEPLLEHSSMVSNSDEMDMMDVSTDGNTYCGILETSIA